MDQAGLVADLGPGSTPVIRAQHGAGLTAEYKGSVAVGVGDHEGDLVEGLGLICTGVGHLGLVDQRPLLCAHVPLHAQAVGTVGQVYGHQDLTVGKGGNVTALEADGDSLVLQFLRIRPALAAVDRPHHMHGVLEAALLVVAHPEGEQQHLVLHTVAGDVGVNKAEVGVTGIGQHQIVLAGVGLEALVAVGGLGNAPLFQTVLVYHQQGLVVVPGLAVVITGPDHQTAGALDGIVVVGGGVVGVVIEVLISGSQHSAVLEYRDVGEVQLHGRIHLCHGDVALLGLVLYPRRLGLGAQSGAAGQVGSSGSNRIAHQSHVGLGVVVLELVVVLDALVVLVKVDEAGHRGSGDLGQIGLRNDRLEGGHGSCHTAHGQGQVESVTGDGPVGVTQILNGCAGGDPAVKLIVLGVCAPDLLVKGTDNGVVHGDLIAVIVGHEVGAVGTGSQAVLIGPGHVPEQLSLGLFRLNVVDEVLQIAVVAVGHTGLQAVLLEADHIPGAVGQGVLNGSRALPDHIAAQSIGLPVGVLRLSLSQIAGVVAQGAGVLLQVGGLHAVAGHTGQMAEVHGGITAEGVADKEHANRLLAHLNGDVGKELGVLAAVLHLDGDGGGAKAGKGDLAAVVHLGHGLVAAGPDGGGRGIGALHCGIIGQANGLGGADGTLSHLELLGLRGDAVAGANHQLGSGLDPGGVAHNVHEFHGQGGLALVGAKNKLTLVHPAQVGVAQSVLEHRGRLLLGQILTGKGGRIGQRLTGHTVDGSRDLHNVVRLGDLQIVDHCGGGNTRLAARQVDKTYGAGLLQHLSGKQVGFPYQHVGLSFAVTLGPDLKGDLAHLDRCLHRVPLVVGRLEGGALGGLHVDVGIGAGGNAVGKAGTVQGINIEQAHLARTKGVALEHIEGKAGGLGARGADHIHIESKGISTGHRHTGQKPVGLGIVGRQLQCLAAGTADDAVGGVAGIRRTAVIAGQIRVGRLVGIIEGVLAHGIGLKGIVQDHPAVLAQISADGAGGGLGRGSLGGRGGAAGSSRTGRSAKDGQIVHVGNRRRTGNLAGHILYTDLAALVQYVGGEQVSLPGQHIGVLLRAAPVPDRNGHLARLHHELHGVPLVVLRLEGGAAAVLHEVVDVAAGNDGLGKTHAVEGIKIEQAGLAGTKGVVLEGVDDEAGRGLVRHGGMNTDIHTHGVGANDLVLGHKPVAHLIVGTQAQEPIALLLDNAVGRIAGIGRAAVIAAVVDVIIRICLIEAVLARLVGLKVLTEHGIALGGGGRKHRQPCHDHGQAKQHRKQTLHGFSRLHIVPSVCVIALPGPGYKSPLSFGDFNNKSRLAAGYIYQ